MRNKNILVVKISVHVSLGMRGADTRGGHELFLLGLLKRAKEMFTVTSN